MLFLYRTQGLRFDHSLQRKNYGNKMCMVASSLAGRERKITGSSFFEESSDTRGEVDLSHSDSKEYVVSYM